MGIKQHAIMGLLLAAAWGWLMSRPGHGMDILPLDQVKPGMAGEWRTAVSGSDIQTFQLRVIGIADHFIGPDQPVIICEATDEENRLSGPVAGMSGSPVFIDGKLIGAYAYGYTWPKQQAIIGVTPIEEMLPVIDEPEVQPTSRKGNSPRWKSVEPASRNRLLQYQSALQPLPSPLFVSGISQRTLEAFRSDIDAFGLDVMNAPMGTARQSGDFTLEAGSPVTAILMYGDFNFGATGTVTYVDGNQLLAFGHSFFQWGEVEIPLAYSEVLTVVRSLPRSFKLSNYGKVFGRVYQDRLTGIAGEAGSLVPMTDFSVHVSYPDSQQKSFSAKMFRHPRFSPLLNGMATMEALTQVHEFSEEQTLTVTTSIKVEGHDRIELTDIFAGVDAAREAAFQGRAIHGLIADSIFDPPAVESFEVRVDSLPRTLVHLLDAVYLKDDTLDAGDEVELTLSLKDHAGNRFRRKVSFPLPEEIRQERVEVMVADAVAAEKVDYEEFFPATRFEHILERLDALKSRDRIYIKILRRSPGISVEGTHLSGLPPSTLALLKNAKGLKIDKNLQWDPVFELRIPVEAEFRGSAFLPLTVR